MSRNQAGESSHLILQSRKKWKLFYCVAGLLALSPCTVSADQLTLRSGQVVNGAIESDAGDEYIVKTDLGTIKLKKSDVSQVAKSGTSPAEIEGDIAFKKGDIISAVASYTGALRTLDPNSEAAQRIKKRLAAIEKIQQETNDSALQGTFAQVQQLISERRSGEAIILLEKVRLTGNLSPQQHAMVNALLARAHYNKGIAAGDNIREIESQTAFREAIKLDAGFYQAYIALGELLLKSSSTDNEGIETIEKGMQIAGDRLPEIEKYRLHYLLGDRYFIKQKYDLAAANFAEVIPAREKFPAYDNALDKTVEAYVKTGEQNINSDFQKTIDNLRQALKLNPNNKKALFLLGRLYSDSGQTENAIHTLEALVKIDPRYNEAYHYLGMAYANARDMEKAVQYLSKELENRPSDYATLVDRAQIYIETREFEKAQADVEAAIALRADDWHARYLSAELALKQQNLEEAKTALDKALELKSDAIPAHILMGRILLAQNDSAGARQWFEQIVNVLGKAPNLGFKHKKYYVETLSELAAMDLEENKPLQAAERLETALASVPNNPSALSSLGDVKRKLSQEAIDPATQKQLQAEAEAQYLKVIGIDALNPENYLKLGVLYHIDFKNLPKALEYYKLYVDRGGRDPRVNTWLVEVGGQPDPRLTPAPSTTTATATLSTGSLELTTGTVTPPVDGLQPLPVVTPATPL